MQLISLCGRQEGCTKDPELHLRTGVREALSKEVTLTRGRMRKKQQVKVWRKDGPGRGQKALTGRGLGYPSREGRPLGLDSGREGSDRRERRPKAGPCRPGAGRGAWLLFSIQ